DIAAAAPSPSRKGGRDRRDKGGRGGRGGGEGGRDRRAVDLSKALSKLLRHRAGDAGVELDREGFAGLEKVLQYPPIRSLAPTFSEIISAVRDSDKQRFALKPNPATTTDPAPAAETSTDPAHWLIRANQGHSIKLDSAHLLRPLSALDPPPPGSAPIPATVVHGTYFAFWPAIAASGGLRPMGRNHVHFSTGVPADGGGGGGSGSAAAAGLPVVVSGMRRDAELLVYVDVAASMAEGGISWWISDNGVVLTEGDADGLVPARFFKEVVGRKQDVGVLWRDGEKVGDLPAGLKMRAPQGKGRR
ncbi:hypothetical protein BT67DRAFT_350163, partial [Trichocladium antarcticum]